MTYYNYIRSFNKYIVMYPFVTIWDTPLYMTWLGIMVSLWVYLITLLWYTRTYKLSISIALYTFPVMLFLCYVWWLYMHHVVVYKTFFVEIWSLISMLSPVWYNFHFVGIAWWYAFFVTLFLMRFPRSSKERKKWIDVFFLSVALSLIPLWFFLILGDDVIGKVYDWFLSVSALTDQSNLTKYPSVFPVWLLYSLLGIISIVITRFLMRREQEWWVWLMWFLVLLLWLSLIFFFQEYPLSWVINISGIRMDIKQYTAWFLFAYVWLWRWALKE